MSATVNIAGGVSARSGVMYALYGRGAENVKHVRDGTTRAAAFACSMGSPEEFIAYAEAQAAANSRKYETYNLVLAGDPKVFDVRNSDDVKKMLGLSTGLVEAAYSAEYLVVMHTDSRGGHVHGHIYVVNHDESTGKALKQNTSWTRGLHQLNDELLVEGGYDPNPDPERPKLDWELRREEFEPGGFEQTLGDLVYESLADPRSVDQAAFESILGERGVALAVTNRDGWSFKMRRTDNGRLGRKKASVLTPDFTAAAVTEMFRQRAAGITAGPQQPVPGFVPGTDEFDQIAMRLKRRMASKKPKTPARERFVRGHQRQHSREYGD